MTGGAELDTRRRSLGLSIAETAEVLGAGVRTVSYWFAGDGEPRQPEELAARLTEVEITMGDIAEDLAEQANDAADRSAVQLTRYRTQAELDASGVGRGLPVGAYSMAIAWAMEELRADGHTVDVRWAEPG